MSHHLVQCICVCIHESLQVPLTASVCYVRRLPAISQKEQANSHTKALWADGESGALQAGRAKRQLCKARQQRTLSQRNGGQRTGRRGRRR